MKKSALSEKTIVILCDGEFPSRGPGLSLIRKAQRAKRSHTVIACDGAILSLLKNGMSADWIVGDMDTLPKKYQAKLKAIIHKEEEQDFNDLCKAFRFALSLIEKDIAEKKRHSYSIVILGATGKREDHALGNISYLPLFAHTVREKFPKRAINISMSTDYGLSSIHGG